jgi:hypothetical protein
MRPSGSSKYTGGVRKFQPRVELWQPWDKQWKGRSNPARVYSSYEVPNPFRVQDIKEVFVPGFKANPGLELANTFGVKTLSGKSRNRVVS